MENKLTYTKVGDYYIPNLTIKPSPPIGHYGRMRRDYLRDHRPALYILREKLGEHCAEVNEAIETVPRRFAINYRNKWMLNKSDIVVTYVTRNFGGAWKLKQMAERLRKQIVNL